MSTVNKTLFFIVSELQMVDAPEGVLNISKGGIVCGSLRNDEFAGWGVVCKS